MPFGVARHNFKARAAAAPLALVSTATWSATIHEAGVILSNGNLTAKGFGLEISYEAGAGTGLVTAGQLRYWETHQDVLAVAGSQAVGIANASNTYATGDYLGKTNNSLGYYDDGTVYLNDALATTIGTYVTGDTVCTAFNGGSKIWFRVNGGNWNNDVIGNQNPANGTGGISVSVIGNASPAYSLANVGGTGPTQMTVNFGGTAFAFTPPAGFTALP